MVLNVKDEFAYLSLITDAYSHAIVGLIHHSDRGSQYCSKDYVKLLNDNHIRISMTENGDPYENAVAERVNGILKSEWIDHEKYACFNQAKERIDQIISIYNTVRPHSSCDMMTPEQAAKQTGKLKKRWKKRKYKQKPITLQKQL